MNSNDNSNFWYSLLVGTSAVFGGINLYRLFKRSEITTENLELQKVIKEKDKIIKWLEKKIGQYQKLIDNDTGTKKLD